MNILYTTLRRLFKLYALLPCLLLYVTLCTIKAVAQPQLVFKRYGVQDGLSDNFVRKVLQDSEGFIWIATEGGLNKFNGYTFKVYKTVPGDSTSLTNHPIIDLLEDQTHTIWVCTWGGGIFLYNRTLDNFEKFKPINAQTGAPLSKYIHTICRDSQGRMWLGTTEGLDLIDVKQRTYRHFAHDPTNPSSLSSNNIMAITEGQGGNLWIGTADGGVNYFNPKTGIFKHYQHQAGDTRSLASNEVYCLWYDTKDRLWVGTWDAGLDMMENPAEGFVHFTHDPAKPNSLANNQVWALTENRQGQLWVGTDNGLAVYEEPTKTFQVYRNDPFDLKSLVGNSIKSLHEDPQGRLWIGTVNSGVCFFDKYLIQMGHHYQRLANHSLSSNNISAFLQTPDREVIIGTDGGGLNLFDQSSNSFTHYKHDFHNPKSIASDKIKALLIDRKQRIWIGFWGGGLDYFNPKQQTFTHFSKTNRNALISLNNNNVTCLAEDQDGAIWLGTFGGGLNKLDPDRNTITYYTNDPTDSTSLRYKYIWDILVDRQNNIWVGTSNGQLEMFDRKRKRFIHIPLHKAEAEGYAIQVLYEDSKGRIWIGLEGGGLRLLDKATLTFKTFDQQTGLPTSTVNAIQETSNGDLWLSSNAGIIRFNPQTGRSKLFGISDGAQGLHFNRQASGALVSGELLFGGNNGFNLFHPDSLSYMNPNVPIVFTDFQIFNKPVLIGEEESPLKAQINQTSSITLSYKQSVFSIEYAGLNYTAPEKVQYQYRLKGFIDESWQQVGSTRKVTYTNLAPGKYVFEVTTEQEGLTNVPIRTLSITIAPPWWQTGWARLLALASICSVLIGINYLRSRSIRLQNKRLEKDVAERTLALQQANASLHEKNLLIHEQKEEIQTQAHELAASNEEIKSINQQLEERVEMRTADLKKTNEELDNFVYRVSHDIRAPLSSVLGLVQLIDLEQDPEQLNLYLKMITKSVNKLDGFVRDILDYSRNSRMQINREEIKFPELLSSIWEELQYMENAQRIQIQTEFTIQAPHYSDARRLQIIFRNLFSNAIKYQNLHRHNPFIQLHILTNQEFASISMKDNGIGIGPAQIEKVFDMFYRGSDLSNGSGIGLYIVKETIEKLGGTIDLQSELGEGTVITIQLPNILP